MTPVELSRTVLRAVRRAVDAGELSVAVPARAVVAPPGPGGCGDYATNIALQLARPAGRSAVQVAEILLPHLVGTDGVADVAITGPGFLNIRLGGADSAVASLVREIGRGSYGHGDALAGQVVPLRIPMPYDIRAEVVADALVRIIATQGGQALVQHAEPPHAEPSHAGLRHAEPSHTGLRHAKLPHTDPSHTDLSHTDLFDTVPSHTDPPGVAPSHTDLRPGGPRHPEGTHPLTPAPSAPAPTAPGALTTPVTLRPVPAPEDPTPLGPDAARWALLHPAGHDRPRIDAGHLLQRESNPLFRVRYAHARTRALTRNAAALGFTGTPGDVPGADDLLGALAEYPRALRVAATHRAPDRLARQLVTTADAFLALQHLVLPLGDEKPSAAHRARLALAEATGTVLAGGLSLLGISAPDYL
ncbi:ArgS-related anticodon-binding protein NrtL [Streptomyces sp. NPDC048448]|uniref:ArgS-related anticodon-binding protein NrtL n=1 Tax=unclassified Streptomyces TaxID=2593676 RepID=UPI00143E22BA|nr:DALR anticodon-binding domain-containing protein [Streptomyces sp. RPA4-2]QIY64652.1 arginine--tRNA ligase [Streptomyces sp. RPA4-2]